MGRQSASEPLVSICIPASRDGESLRAAVASVLAQDHDDLEVVIGDDSGGALKAVAEQLGDPRIRYHANHRPLGLAGNHMDLLARARGRYLGFLHDDDRFLPHYVSTLLERFEAEPTVGVVFSDCWIDRGTGAWDRRRIELAGGRYERFLPEVVRHEIFIPSTTMLRREVWEGSPQAWPDLVCADLALYVDAALAGWPFVFVDEPLVVYRKHPGQIGVDEVRHRDHNVAFWEGYRFEDPEAERLRREKLAHWLVARAGARLKEGAPADARADLERARRLAPAVSRPRRHALRVLSRAPGLVPAAQRAWRRVRPPERAAPLNADPG